MRGRIKFGGIENQIEMQNKKCIYLIGKNESDIL